eukprot:scaffold256455_cov16-Tisochrysis_lutea.AAC.1
MEFNAMRRVAMKWLNDPEVRQAIHAAPISAIGQWSLCSDKVRGGAQKVPPPAHPSELQSWAVPMAVPNQCHGAPHACQNKRHGQPWAAISSHGHRVRVKTKVTGSRGLSWAVENTACISKQKEQEGAVGLAHVLQLISTTLICPALHGVKLDPDLNNYIDHI